MEYSQVVRQSFLVRSFKGSNPFIPIFFTEVCIYIYSFVRRLKVE